MELVIISLMSVIVILALGIVLKFNLNNIKLIKHIGKSKELNEITNALPENEQICRDFLKILKNEDVRIKVGNENSQSSLYIVATNSILIANIKNTFTRVQTIAHECIHSVQDKCLLWFNFIFSNIYLFYFFTITLLALFNKLPEENIFAIILLMMSVILYFVRSYIEIDAMTKARFVAKEYMEKNKDLISENDINIVVENYDKLNEIGIKFYCFKLLFDYLIKVIAFCIIAIL